MFNLEDLIREMKASQPALKEMDQKLKALQFTAEAGAGLVKVTVNGRKQVVRIEIDHSLLQAEEKITLQDLIVAAINLALKDVDVEIKQLISMPDLLKSFL